MKKKPELSIDMPCLNEAETLATCITKAQNFLNHNQVEGEIIIADNGSTDGSQEIAKHLNARVVPVNEKGYGSALRGGIEKGAMPFLHKYLGNPVLSFLGRLFYKIDIGDFHCGLRGFSKIAYYKMDLKTTGMEFASEMIVKSKLNNLKIAEVPTTLKPDGRTRAPHLNTWRDGWRHLRFLLLYSPQWLFLIPGICLILFGAITSAALISQPIAINSIQLDIHTLLYTSSSVLIGFQFIVFYALTKIYAVENNLLPKSERYQKLFKYLNLETGLIIGVLFLIIGIGLSYFGLSIWKHLNFGELNPSETLRIIIPAVFTILLGMQIIFFSLFFSILGLKSTND